MLAPRDITAWTSHAPWATEAQVEQDLLITQAVVAIFQDRFLSEQVAMRGGTVLHKLHLAPAARYSEDIDLVAVGERPRGHLVRALMRVLDPIMGAKPVANLQQRVALAVRNVAKPNDIARLVYEYQPTTQIPPVAKLKVEVNLTERTSVIPLVRLPYAPPLPSGTATVYVVSYALNEMLGTKLRALLQRDHGRDLFDLSHAWTHCHATGRAEAVSGPEVARIFTRYMTDEGSTVSRARFERDLQRKLSLQSFRADLADVLPVGRTFDVGHAAHVVRTEFLAHLA